MVLGVETQEPPERGFVHKALLYGGTDDFVGRALPFLRQGLRDGTPTLVVVAPDKIDLLRSHLGDDARRVRFEDMRQLGDNPARIIPAWRDFAEDHDGAPLRGIGEPIWPGREAAELEECQLHEALVNVAFDGTQLELLCPYDVEGLAPEVVSCARHTHPTVCNSDVDHASDTYDLDAAQAIFAGSLPPAPARREELRFTTGPLHDFRAFIDEHARRAGVGGVRLGDTVLAANEIASNSLLHGGGAGLARAWSHDGSFVCEIRDDGQVEDLLVGRRRPARDETSGRGVWMANQLCDLVQVRSSDAGTTVRLHVRVDPARRGASL
jgi:anti-sigma regulatory factor (Ser/Thr protein kinase)